jgi:hypothetical protein
MKDTQNVSTAGAPLCEQHAAPVQEQHGGYVDRREYLYDDPLFNGGPFAFVSSRDDRRDGAFRPVYANEHDLAQIRGAARQLVELSGIRTGALDALTNYVLGGGFRYVVHSLPACESIFQTASGFDRGSSF